LRTVQWLITERRLTVRCCGVKRGARGVGIPVDPARVREARIQAGLSMGQVGGTDVSRTMIHLVEHGRARPSRKVLELIARRTRKPIGYFLLPTASNNQPTKDLVDDLTGVANRVREFTSANRLTTVEREAMKFIEMTLHQAADLARSVQANHILNGGIDEKLRRPGKRAGSAGAVRRPSS